MASIGKVKHSVHNIRVQPLKCSSPNVGVKFMRIHSSLLFRRESTEVLGNMRHAAARVTANIPPPPHPRTFRWLERLRYRGTYAWRLPKYKRRRIMAPERMSKQDQPASKWTHLSGKEKTQGGLEGGVLVSSTVKWQILSLKPLFKKRNVHQHATYAVPSRYSVLRSKPRKQARR